MTRTVLTAITLAIRATWHTPLRSPVCRLADVILDGMDRRQLAA